MITQFYLHSNMDRLKLARTSSILKTTLNLHSNMDRLKPRRAAAVACSDRDLHSNMDRLKLSIREIPQSGRLIYIPIWID